MVFMGAALAIVLIRIISPVMSVAYWNLFTSQVECSNYDRRDSLFARNRFGLLYCRWDARFESLLRDAAKSSAGCGLPVYSSEQVLLQENSILGVLIAVLIVLEIKLDKVFGINLNFLSRCSSLFFAWSRWRLYLASDKNVAERREFIQRNRYDSGPFNQKIRAFIDSTTQIIRR